MASAWFGRPGTRFQSGHDVALLENGGEFFPALEAELASAQIDVFVETYIFLDDPTGQRVARALADAANRGVKVHLLIDGFGTGTLQGEVARVLRASSVVVETFRPERRMFSPSPARLRRLHRKLVVIDGKTAFVGGINLMDDFFDPHFGALEFPRFDFAVRVRGPLVVDVVRSMHRLWRNLHLVNAVKSKGAAAAAISALKAVGSGEADAPETAQSAEANAAPAMLQGPGRIRAMFVLRDNFRFRRTIERSYLRAIGRARREVLIANAYFFPGARFRRALIAAASRGVKVKLLLQGRVEYWLQHYASQALYDELLLAGIEIVEYQRSFMHAKVAVIDDWATVGSSNIDPFSLLLAREANVVVNDRGFAADLRGRLQRAMLEGGAPIALRRHASRAWPLRLLNRFAYLILRAGVSLTGLAGRY
jgi:cardiolipin synthase A/B